MFPEIPPKFRTRTNSRITGQGQVMDVGWELERWEEEIACTRGSSRNKLIKRSDWYSTNIYSGDATQQRYPCLNVQKSSTEKVCFQTLNVFFFILEPRRTQNVNFSIASDSSFYFCHGFYGPRKEENNKSFNRIGQCKHPKETIKVENFLELRFWK